VIVVQTPYHSVSGVQLPRFNESKAQTSRGPTQGTSDTEGKKLAHPAKLIGVGAGGQGDNLPTLG